MMNLSTPRERLVSVMQPYLFPYLGYIQLIAASGHFVCYDDVNFIKQGWINRNRILVNGQPFTFTIPCKGISSNVFIHDVQVDHDKKEYSTFLKTLELAYRKAPFFADVFPLIEELWRTRFDSIASLAKASLELCCDYLEIPTRFHVSSESFPGLTDLYRADRLIQIVKTLDGQAYLNLSGGKELYEKQYFEERGVDLWFHKILDIHAYPQQQTQQFHPHLSILDLMMNLPKSEVQVLLLQCQWE
jgi:hypothetical protein